MSPNFQDALRLHQSGRLAEADAIYRQILATEPNHPGATHYSGLLLHHCGQHQPALAMMLRSLELEPDSLDFLNNLAVVYQSLGQWDAAIDMFRRVLELAAGSVDALNNLGNALRLRGRAADAEPYLRQAVEATAGKTGQAASIIRANLGMCHLDRGKLADAVKCFEESLRLDPSQIVPQRGMGLALRALGRLAEAERFQRDVVRRIPGDAQAHNDLGVTLSWMDDPVRAIESFERARALVPQYAGYHLNVGNVLREVGRAEEAVAACKRAVELDPSRAEAEHNLGYALLRLGDPMGAVEHVRKATVLAPDNAQLRSALLVMLMHDPRPTPAQLFEEHLAFAARHARADALPARSYAVDRTPDRKLRLGYVSPDFRSHSVGHFIAPIIDGHDRDQFEVVCYFTSLRRDSTTDQIRARAKLWRDVRLISDAEFARQIHDDRIDILIDLAVHSGENRLPVFAGRPAPVQMSYLGYPGTTGLRQIDYKVTDQFIDPAGQSEQFHTEKLARVDGCYFCYPAPTSGPDVVPPPALNAGHVTFASFNNVTKVNAQVLGLWARLLAEVPESRLLLAFAPVNSPKFEARVRQIFQRAGIAPDRIRFMLPVEFRKYLEAHANADIVLDPFPFNGGTTTCHALWMGLPLVTLAGAQGVSRMGASFLHHLDLSDLVAHTPDEYVRIASQLARNTDRLRDLRLSLRQRMLDSPIMNRAAAIRSLESIYRNAWVRFGMS